jgi:transposase
VRFAQAYILGRLRNVTFFSLAECNAAIAVAVERMNGREMRRLGMSRRQLFEAIERPVMRALPQDDFEYAEWHLARVGIDYHVEVQGFFYSVPHVLIREQVDTRATQRTVEVFHRGKRVAAHARRYGGPRHGTLPEHMPSAHRRYAEWTPERLQRDARGIGPATEALIIAVMARRPHPEQGFRTCLGILRLFRGLEAARAEAASHRAVEIGALSYASVASILKHRLDRTTSPSGATDDAPLLHDNIRGSGYYH